MGAHFEALDEDVLLVPLDPRYTHVGFNLVSVQVWDALNLSQPQTLYLIKLDWQMTSLTVARLDLFSQKIRLLLSDGETAGSGDGSGTGTGSGSGDSPYHVNILGVTPRHHSGNKSLRYE